MVTRFPMTVEQYCKIGRIGIKTEEQSNSITSCTSMQEMLELPWLKSVWDKALPYGKIASDDETKQLKATVEIGSIVRLSGGYPENEFSVEGTTGRYDSMDFIDWTSNDWYHGNYWRGPYGGQHHPSVINKHEFIYNIPENLNAVRVCAIANQYKSNIGNFRINDEQYRTFNVERINYGIYADQFILYYINTDGDIARITNDYSDAPNFYIRYPEGSSYVRFVTFNACYNNGNAMENANSPIIEGTNNDNGYNLDKAFRTIASTDSTQGRSHFFTRNVDYSFWIFETEAEAREYLLNGTYSTALNYDRNTLHGDFMDLNIAGNSEQPNAVYQFIDPVAGLAYNTAQQIKINWTIEGATKNPLISKETIFNIPINAHCFVLFTGKYVGVYCDKPDITMEMNVFNNKQLIGTVNKQSDIGLLEVQDIFGMYEGYEPEGGTYNVKIYTPFIFIRQIYKCASKEELPQKGDPTYEIFQPGTSSAYVNPNDTGELASAHLLSFNSISEMKAASDAEN